ncbi:MAG: GTPase ObgE [Alphaproteobacteria bacterium]|nr:MAG: GTPase ObgE [Alphaproteobacteria bacterium]
MDYIDRVVIKVQGGNGGDGCISFRRESSTPKGGPDGGDGGSGGDVFFIGDHNVLSLADFKYKKVLKAENGKHGEGSLSTGKSGSDLYIKVPLGTQIFENNVFVSEILENEQKFLVARGGQKGLGNKRFAKPDLQAPRIRTTGQEGESREFSLVLKQIADVGVVGKPNAGKSTFIKSISNAPVIIADYPFSTIKPKLATVTLYGKTLTFVDIPGLIEDSCKGKGLGYRFLQHIERCKVLLHLVDVTGQYEVDINCIRKELSEYNDVLLSKIACLCLTKIDLVTEERLNLALTNCKKIYQHIFCIDSYSKKGLDELLKFVYAKLSTEDQV